LSDALRKAMSSRLGLRDASENRANAVVRGTITKYEPDVPVAFSADPNQATTARRSGNAKACRPKANTPSGLSPRDAAKRSSAS
jgi:hypothetical protein